MIVKAVHEDMEVHCTLSLLLYMYQMSHNKNVLNIPTCQYSLKVSKIFVTGFFEG